MQSLPNKSTQQTTAKITLNCHQPKEFIVWKIKELDDGTVKKKPQNTKKKENG